METTHPPKRDDSPSLQMEGLIDEVTSLMEITERLKEWVMEAETRSQKVTVLSEVADLILSCRTVAETGEMVSRHMTKLFPGSSGALFLVHPERKVMERGGTWGSLPPEEPDVSPARCIALRRGDVHLVADTSDGSAVCELVRAPLPPAYMCVPLRVGGEPVGVLHIRFSRAIDPSSRRQQKEHHDHVSALASTVSTLLGLSFSNIALREAAAEAAVRDPLTGLYNRRFLYEAAPREISRLTRSKGDISVLLLDVDGFRAINEQCGFAAGDAVLRDLSHFLRRFLRGGDIPCRWGADEFLLVLPDSTLEGAVGRAGKLREAVEALTFRHGEVSTGRVTVSIGVASWPLHGHTLEEVIRVAETALEDTRKADGKPVCVAGAPGSVPPRGEG